uniref:Trehalase n=1 Tax=Dermatophagoides pteronyssinus TaxID=6956 RepID=A0A6P6YKG2_DERPT|nr:probable trehalase [Dermatophagoides pteronyssinus]
MVKMWKYLYRRVNPNFDSECHTLISLPRPFIVPGGRFIEIYYWDSYWIVLGLIASGLLSVVRDSLINFFYMVERYGFIPNGSRVYYLDRSQPPLLSSMLRAYYHVSEDLDFVIEHLPLIEREYNFWMNSLGGHVVELTDEDGKVHLLNRHYSILGEPRPESYRMDLLVGEVFEKKYSNDEAVKAEFYRSIRAAAESGWDFSSRWLRPAIEGAEEKSPYGVVSTTIRASLQWDSPNVWAPSHHIAVDFLCGGRFWEKRENVAELKETEAFKIAASWASRFLNTILYRYEHHGICSEKYHCRILGKSGLDGEYITQEGFGWTNGAVLDLMWKFGRHLTVDGLFAEVVQ